ncbi:MAG: hypothetical protein M5Z89_15995 [Olivibacter sp.]|nr:hypothetical protein [Olivibacter sp. UJ_SKK_5.1]
MKTKKTKPTSFLNHKLLVWSIIQNGTLWVHPKSLQSPLKNIIASPE